MNSTFPNYSIGERRVDACIHVLGVGASIAGATALIVMASGSLPAVSSVSLLVYGTGLLAMFAFSAAYNLVSWPRAKAVLRRFDHAAIYLKIAATYTPFVLVKMGGLIGFGLLALVWSIAAFGVTAKIQFPGRLVKTSYVLYLAQGWVAVIALEQLSAAVSGRVLVLLGVGGVLYTIGVAFHLWHSLRYHNAIWHAFVLVASGCFYTAVVDAVALG